MLVISYLDPTTHTPKPLTSSTPTHPYQMLVISSLDPTNPTPQASDIIDAHTLINCDSKASVLRGLSVLELCLIIAMKHINELHDGDPFNFEMVYKGYICRTIDIYFSVLRMLLYSMYVILRNKLTTIALPYYIYESY